MKLALIGNCQVTSVQDVSRNNSFHTIILKIER